MITENRIGINPSKNNEMEYGGESFRDLIQEVEPEITHEQLIEFAKFLGIENPVQKTEDFVVYLQNK